MTTLRTEISPRESTDGRRRGLSLAPATLVAAVVALAVQAGAPMPTATGSSASDPLVRTFHSTETSLSTAQLAESESTWTGGPQVAKTGEAVTVYVSPQLPVELGTPQTWADFLAGLVHGPELSALRAYIGTFDEMRELCGEDALGCYTPDTMVSVGEPVAGVTAAEVVRHEYGHHIAFHRLNAPWPAIDWGPKHWSSAERVCAREADGTAYPGNEGDRYFLNPGEAWAETYRLLDERHAGITSFGWPIIDSSFYPDEAALRAAERDVLRPWSSGRTVVHTNRFATKGKRVWTIPLATPLDGSIEIAVSMPRGGLHEVALVDVARKRVLAIGLWAGQTVKKVVANVCGQRTLAVRITQRGAYGRVKVRALVP